MCLRWGIVYRPSVLLALWLDGRCRMCACAGFRKHSGLVKRETRQCRVSTLGWFTVRRLIQNICVCVGGLFTVRRLIRHIGIVRLRSRACYRPGAVDSRSPRDTRMCWFRKHSGLVKWETRQCRVSTLGLFTVRRFIRHICIGGLQSERVIGTYKFGLGEDWPLTQNQNLLPQRAQRTRRKPSLTDDDTDFGEAGILGRLTKHSCYRIDNSG